MLRQIMRNRPRATRPSKPRARQTRRATLMQALESRQLMAADVGHMESGPLEPLELSQTAIVGESVPGARIVNGQQTNGFEAVGIVNGQCTGTLITPNHVLTAAHCTEGMNASQMTFEVGGQTYRVTSEQTHPNYNPNQFDRGFDLAVMTLDRPVVGIQPHDILRTTPQVGETLTLVGFGEGGTTASGSLFDFGTKRVGETTIDEVTQNHISWNFDAGESNTAPGDSGGPAFISSGGQLLVAGVTSGGSGDPHTIGDFSFDTRVDTLANWIDGITGGVSDSPVDPPVDPPVDEPPVDDPPVDDPVDPVAGGDDHVDQLGPNATEVSMIDGLGLSDGILEEAGDADVFSFTVDADGEYEIAMLSQADDIDTSLTLLDTRGDVVASVSEMGSTADSVLHANLSPGDYYVVAESADGEDTGAYFLDVVQLDTGAGFGSDLGDGGLDPIDVPADDFPFDDFVDADPVNDGDIGSDPGMDDGFDDGFIDHLDDPSEEPWSDWEDDWWMDDESSDDWWSLPFSPQMDCNRDHRLSAVDALMVINDISANGQRTVDNNAQEASALDANGDKRISALDALVIINALSQATDMDAETVVAHASTMVGDSPDDSSTAHDSSTADGPRSSGLF